MRQPYRFTQWRQHLHLHLQSCLLELARYTIYNHSQRTGCTSWTKGGSEDDNTIYILLFSFTSLYLVISHAAAQTALDAPWAPRRTAAVTLIHGRCSSPVP